MQADSLTHASARQPNFAQIPAEKVGKTSEILEKEDKKESLAR